MKAIRMHDYGGPEVLELEEVDKPEIGDDQVLVKVYATSINPVDWKIRDGARKEKFPSALPLIPGWDVSGVVEETGSAVRRFKKGDEVYGRADPTKNGAYAEYIAVGQDLLSLKPRSLDHLHAACVPLAGLTAWQALFDYGRLEKGQKVLIHGASGGVGTFAVQFAKWKGAYVIGTASDENLRFVKQLGADEMIDYHNERFENRVHDADLVIDTIGGDTQRRSLTVVRPGGRVISTLAAEFTDEAKKRDVHLESFMAHSYPEQLDHITQLIDEGLVEPVISMSMNLDETPKAQQISKEGHVRGKIAIKVV